MTTLPPVWGISFRVKVVSVPVAMMANPVFDSARWGTTSVPSSQGSRH